MNHPRRPALLVCRLRPALAYLLLAAFVPHLSLGGDGRQILLDGQWEGRTFEGIGALSAGASSRMLIEYAEPYRRQVLDYLFKPRYGAGFQHLKVEIGGDVNSTDGCEPSHMHTRRDLNYQRGYEWWLMKEARVRNPRLFLDCLEWGAPAWIGNGEFYSQDNADYIVKFIQGAQSAHQVQIDYVGIWNETRANMGWIKRLRRALDRRQLQRVQIVAADDINRWNLAEVLETDPELARAVQVVGVHYPKYQSTPAAQRCGKPIWANEDGPWKGNWAGAGALAKLYNRNYLEGRMTKTIIWSPITAYYDNLPLPGSGVMKANTPWSGHYTVQPALWATAHTTQFAEPGWTYLAGAAEGLLPTGGSYVTLKSPNGADFSVIIETIDAQETQTVTFRITGGLAAAPLHVWRTLPSEHFARLPDLVPQAGVAALDLAPGAIYSLTTTTGQTKGDDAGAPAAPFPVPYAEHFESYPTGATPRYFSDQAGIFEVARRAQGEGQSLRQIIHRKGIEWPLHLNAYPETFLGDPLWSDYEVAVDALIEKAGFVSLFGRVGNIPQNANPPGGYWFKVDQDGQWELGTATVALASGQAPFSANTWRRLKLRFAGALIMAFIDDQLLIGRTDETYGAGMVGLGCGWHGAQFDNLAIAVDPSDRNLAFAKPAMASSSADPDTDAANVTDGDPFTTRWSAASGQGVNEWVAIDFGADVAFNTVVVRQFEDRIRAYKVQYWSDGDWCDAFSGGVPGAARRTVSFATVTAPRLRFLVTEAQASPSLWELEVRCRR
jgi:galactosylceramidase